MPSLPPPPPNGDFSNSPRTDARAVAALVCGVLGLLILPLVFGAVAVILGRRSRQEISEQPLALKGLGLATAGVVLGAIDVVVFVIFVVA